MKTQSLIPRLVELAETTAEVKVLWLYGSRAKNTERPDSDIDLAIRLPAGCEDKQLVAEELAIEWASELNLPDNTLSVVEISQAPIFLAYNIVEYGKVVHCKDGAELYRQTQRVYSMYEFAEYEAEHG
ncbi:type VII toxin-antitoxin system MntA family adenylyltransferase antitoxin [Lacimicrobium alkaliphilum]|uniref:Polymerase beta nucleotidyltransferase domain-containing protein n=1 Tax=Lacimicrobium alkaliphilum TaxID=1526571 RepID=A0ABQ1R6J6_9ALTE|nr:nucleotidyltransferase domain-containing protein [Lacimicrobium alkaliphilum]GGD57776.1 hypothetical protein GCM10011357_11450 [Lacimicrobium alkaliphilum]